MSELKNWSSVNPSFTGTPTCGWTFHGKESATQEDFAELQAHLPFPLTMDIIDHRTLGGRWDRDWTTGPDLLMGTDPWDMDGGLGSSTYRTQHVGAGVGFRDAPDQVDVPIWHFDPDGNYVKAILNYERTGTAFYRDMYNSTRAGPEPGTEADEILGNGRYVFDEDNGWYVVE